MTDVDAGTEEVEANEEALPANWCPPLVGLAGDVVGSNGRGAPPRSVGDDAIPVVAPMPPLLLPRAACRLCFGLDSGLLAPIDVNRNDDGGWLSNALKSIFDGLWGR